MKLTDKTLTVLENFATINDNVILHAGDHLRTGNVAGNLLATAKVDQEFPQDVPIYSLNEFLSVLRLFKEPDLEFADGYIVISDVKEGTSSVRYFCAEESLIANVPMKTRLSKEPDVSFTLKFDTLKKVLTAAKTLNATNITLMNVKKDGRNVLILRAHQLANPSSNVYDVEVGTYDGDRTFEVDFFPSHLKFLEMDYVAQISLVGACAFVNEEYGIKYFIAMTKPRVS